MLGFRCSACLTKGEGTGTVLEKKELLLDDGKLECVNKFCYLGDMSAAGGGAEEA